MLQNLGYRGHLETGYVRRIRRRRHLNITTAFLFVSLAGLIVCAGILAHEFTVAREAVEERARLNAGVRDLLEAEIRLQQAETGQRGYLLTGKRSYLVPYERASRELPAQIDAIAARADAPTRAQIESIGAMINHKLAELAETIRLYDTRNSAAALELVQTDVGQTYMDEARNEIETLANTWRGQRDAVDGRALAGINAVRIWTFLTIAALMTSIGVFAVQMVSLARARTAYETKLATQTSMLNAVIDEIPAMVAIWDLDSRYRLVNKSFERWRRCSRSQVIGKSVQEFVSPEEFAVSQPYIERALTGETVTYEKDFAGAGVQSVSVTYSPLVLEGGEIGGVVALAHDVTHQQAERVRLKRLSERDPLTGLMNRAGFEAFLSAVAESGEGASVGLVYIDLDHFKPVNDQYGHAAGDEVLRIFAERLQQIVRPTDAIVRLGGDEFAIALCGLRRRENASLIADKVSVLAREPIGAHFAQISASIGVAFDASLQGGWKSLIARADKMAYEAKHSGRGRVCIEPSPQE